LDAVWLFKSEDDGSILKVATGRRRTIKFAVRFETQTRPIARSRAFDKRIERIIKQQLLGAMNREG
jgi:hypothetical protein